MNVYINGNFFSCYERTDHKSLISEFALNLGNNGTILVVDVGDFPYKVWFVDISSGLELCYINNEVTLNRHGINLGELSTILESAITDNSEENIQNVNFILSEELSKVSV